MNPETKEKLIDAVIRAGALESKYVTAEMLEDTNFLCLLASELLILNVKNNRDLEKKLNFPV